MADIEWIPERPKDAAFAARVEDIVHVTIGRNAEGKVTLVLEDLDVVRVPPARLVPSPETWDTWDEPIRVDDGIVEALQSFGITAK
jgi:hypothetical protein